MLKSLSVKNGGLKNVADSRHETKVVEYVLQGNTVQLDKALQQAIKNIDVIDAKLTRVAAQPRMLGGKDVTSFERANVIAAAEEQLSQLRTILARGLEQPQLISPDQLNLINQIVAELEKVYGNLNKAKSEVTVTNKTLQKTKAQIRAINHALRVSNTLFKETKVSLKEIYTRGLRIYSTILILIRAFEKLYTAAADFTETINLFNVATKGSKQEMNEFAESMAKAYGTDIRPIYNAIAVFRQYANTLGFAKEQSDLFAQGLTQLTYDLASLYNVEYSEMEAALKSGMAGQTKSLMRYGISVHQATLEQTALTLGIEKQASEWTAAEKVALRYLTVLQETTSAQGDLARTLESPTNQFKILKGQLQVLLRNGGAIVVLISQKLMPVLNGFLISFNSFLESLAKAAGYEIEDYSDNLSPTNQMLSETEEAADDAADAIKGFLAPLDEINQANTAQSDQNDLFGSLDPQIAEAIKSYDNLASQIQTKTQAIGEMFNKVFSPLAASGIGSVFGGAFKLLGQSIETVVSVLKMLAPALHAVSVVLGAIMTAVGWVLDKVVNPILKFVETLTSNIWLLVAAFTAFNFAQLAVTGSMTISYRILKLTWNSILTGFCSNE